MNLVTQTDLSLFETSKTERQEFAQSVINNAKEGLLKLTATLAKELNALEEDSDNES